MLEQNVRTLKSLKGISDLETFMNYFALPGMTCNWQKSCSLQIWLLTCLFRKTKFILSQLLPGSAKFSTHFSKPETSLMIYYFAEDETSPLEGAVDASMVYVASWFIGKLAFTTSRPPPWKMEAGLWHKGQIKWPNISFFDGLELRVLQEYLEAGLDDLPKQYLNTP